MGDERSVGNTVKDRGVRIPKGDLEKKRSLGYLIVYLEFLGDLRFVWLGFFWEIVGWSLVSVLST